MINDLKYVTSSLELHLFFSRLMKEHLFFLEAGFTKKDEEFGKEASILRKSYETLLQDIVSFGNGFIPAEVLKSGEIVTELTDEAERITQQLTGILINRQLTKSEMELTSGGSYKSPAVLADVVRKINSTAKHLTEKTIEFKSKVINQVSSCKMFTYNFPMLLEHTLHEAKLYKKYIEAVESHKDFTEEHENDSALVWDHIMLQHALFMRSLFDPSEGNLITAADNFAERYSQLIEKTISAGKYHSEKIKQETKTETEKFRDFKQQGTDGIIHCKIKSIIVPLLADHLLREANHYLRIMNK